MATVRSEDCLSALLELEPSRDGRPPGLGGQRGSADSHGIGYRCWIREEDERRTLRSVIDVSGDPGILDQVVPRLSHRGEIVLGGFYADPLTLTFPPAFLKEARFQVAAEFTPDDLAVVVGLVSAGALSSWTAW